MSKLKQISEVALLLVVKKLLVLVHFLDESGFVNQNSLTVSRPCLDQTMNIWSHRLRS
jgi:hypothetical protein